MDRAPSPATMRCINTCTCPPQVQYGAIRVTAIDRKGLRVSKRARLVYFVWQGPTCGIRLKGAAVGHKGTLQSFFNGFSLSYQWGDKDDFSEDVIIKDLLAAGGAHAPDE